MIRLSLVALLVAAGLWSAGPLLLAHRSFCNFPALALARI